MSDSESRLKQIIDECLKDSGAIYEYKTDVAYSKIWIDLIQPLLYATIKLKERYSELLEETAVSQHQFSIEQADKVLKSWGI